MVNLENLFFVDFVVKNSVYLRVFSVQLCVSFLDCFATLESNVDFLFSKLNPLSLLISVVISSGCGIGESGFWSR